MVESSVFYSLLSTKDSFNTSVRHITRTLNVLDACGVNVNAADKINEALGKKEMAENEVLSLINMLCVDKWRYAAFSGNLHSVVDDARQLIDHVATWKKFDFILGYHHPDLGFIVLNPKNPESAAVIAGFRKNELLTVYAGTPDDTQTPEAAAAAALLFRLVEGESVKTPASLLQGKFVFVAPKKPAAKRSAPRRSGAKASYAPKAAASATRSGPVVVMPAPTQDATAAPVAPQQAQPAPAVGAHAKMTPFVSVVVTNELFHNGNVEAWKRIIHSYNAKYPNLQVNVYYDGERIVDINTLFKWGKVKHGSCIQFTVSGENIQDVAKLSRYFRQGASPQFEVFLKGSPDSVMNLF